MEEKNDRKINYRELQSIAKRLQLPGNLKYHLLLEVIEARRSGKEYIVNKILSEQKLERVRRKKEKLEAREAAYQHLKISQDRKQSGKLRKTLCHGPPLPDSSTVPSWPSPTAFHANNIRSLLSMPVESFQELLRKSKEQEILKTQHHATERPFYYSDYQESLSRRLLLPNQNFLQDVYQPMRDDDSLIRDEFILENPARGMYPCVPAIAQRSDYADTSAQVEQQSKKASFQMKDILSQNDPNWCVSYGQSYCMGGTYDGNQSTGEVANPSPYLSHEPYIAHYPSYLASSDHWRNVYEMNQDNYNWRYLEYSGIQGVSGSSGEAASSPNSDTVSATDEDLPKDSISALENCRYNGIPVPVQNYYALPSEQNGFQESSYIPELPAAIDESQLSEASLPPDRACTMKMCAS